MCIFLVDDDIYRLLMEIRLVHSKDQSWVFFGRNDAKAETPVLWPPHAKSWLTGKDSDAGRDWGQDEKGMTEDEMAGWHEWPPEVGDGQGGLVCCDSWGLKESDMTEQLNWTELNVFLCNHYIYLEEMSVFNFYDPVYNYFSFCRLCFGVHSKNSSLPLDPEDVLHSSFPKIFIVLYFLLEFMTHF